MAAMILVTLLAACGGGSGSAAATYTIAVRVSGLSGGGLVLQLNMADDLAVAADGNYTFSTALAFGASFIVTVKTQPSSVACAVTNGAGIVSNSNVTATIVNCTVPDCPLPSNSGGSPVPTPTAFVLDTGSTPGTNVTNGCVIGYPANLSGPVNPTVSITLPAPAARYVSLTTDSAGYIYVAANTGQAMQGEVLVFAPGATGMAAPVRTFTFPGFIYQLPNMIAVDGNGAVYVATDNTTGNSTSDSILVFAPGADGNAAPIRTIAVNSGVTAVGCEGLAVDGNGNIICAFRELGLIQVFTNAPTGNGTPARTISVGSEIVGISLDPAGNIHAAAAGELNINVPIRILEFAGGAAGAGTPIGTLPSDALPGNVNVRSLGFDAAGNLYVYEIGTADSNGDPTVLRFATAANGFAPPTTETLVSFPNYVGGTLGFSVD